MADRHMRRKRPPRSRSRRRIRASPDPRRNDVEIKELGHLVLYVRDLERSRAFYRDVLGWPEIATMGTVGAIFSSGRTHHELLLLEVGEGAAPIPAGRRVGLYHFGLKVGTSDEELRAAIGDLTEAGVPIMGTADHTVTHSVYIADPDGNEIELYIDVQPERWREEPAAIVAPVRPLRL
jgi:catechol-2,3-dioxygenase